MFAAVASHLPRPTLAEATLTGRRYGGAEAVAAGIAAEAVAEDEVVPRAVELAGAMAGKDRGVIRAHKVLLHGAALETCGTPPA
jgi:enoyl-CoA hydratase/carnithine racemase